MFGLSSPRRGARAHSPNSGCNRAYDSYRLSKCSFWVYLGVRSCDIFLCYCFPSLSLFCQLFVALFVLCFTSPVSFTGSYTEDEPSFFILDCLYPVLAFPSPLGSISTVLRGLILRTAAGNRAYISPSRHF